MANPSKILNAAIEPDPPQVYEGRIAKAPTGLDDEVYVVIPDIDDQALSEPCNWEPAIRSDGLYFPVKGAPCLVAFPYTGDPWVVEFWVVSGKPDVPVTGEQGPEGPEGPAGPAGPEGPQGKQGVEGKQGPEGKQGVEGKQGLQGVEGPQGKEGKEGKEGPQGKEGKEGPQGKEGAAGMGIINARYASTANVAFATRTGNKLESSFAVTLAEVLGEGSSPAVGNYILLKNQTTAADNGVYQVINTGAGGVKWVMERVPEMDSSADLRSGMIITVAEGTRNADRQFTLTTDGTLTLNTTGLTFAVIAPKDFGIVTELPTSKAIAGDKCSYKADATNGIMWDLVYDGEGTYPWKKIGGPPLLAEIETIEETSSATYTNLTTVGPSITAPLKGDYVIELGCYLLSNNAAVNAARMAPQVGAVEANDEDAVVGVQKEGLGFASVSRKKKKAGIAAATAIVAKYKVQTAAQLMKFRSRWMSIDPNRVG